MKEREIQLFLLAHKSEEISVMEVENFKKMLVSRQILMKKLPNRNERKRKK